MTAPALAPGLQGRLARVVARGETPLAVLDVDLTLIDNAPRNRAIWGEWLHSVRGRWPSAVAAAERAQTMPIVFGVRDNLAALGVDDPELAADGLRFWLRTFFTSDFCRFDVALPGAVEATRALLAAGATVVYLTARPSRMVDGTAACFRRVGLPIGEAGTILTMKPDLREDDAAFKVGALDWIGRLGTPILVADNEPGHVNAMRAAFPEALAVHVATRHSAGAPALDSGAAVVGQLIEAVVAREA